MGHDAPCGDLMPPSDVSDYPLVMIEWEDSHACGTWQELDGDIEDMALVCRSVGWLVLDGEHAKVIAPHLSQEGAGVPLQGNGIMTIPARAILQLVQLRGDES